MCFSLPQCEKVCSLTTLIDVGERSTWARFLQFSHARDPRKLASPGSVRLVSPDEQKQPGGTPRYGGGNGSFGLVKP